MLLSHPVCVSRDFTVGHTHTHACLQLDGSHETLMGHPPVGPLPPRLHPPSEVESEVLWGSRGRGTNAPPLPPSGGLGSDKRDEGGCEGRRGVKERREDPWGRRRGAEFLFQLSGGITERLETVPDAAPAESQELLAPQHVPAFSCSRTNTRLFLLIAARLAATSGTFWFLLTLQAGAPVGKQLLPLLQLTAVAFLTNT